jgi:hypothetical protein
MPKLFERACPQNNVDFIACFASIKTLKFKGRKWWRQGAEQFFVEQGKNLFVMTVFDFCLNNKPHKIKLKSGLF